MRRLFLASAAILLFGIRPASAAAPAARPAPAADAAGDSIVSMDTLIAIEETGVRLGSGVLREPIGLDVDIRGSVYVADAMAGKVFRISPDGEALELERPRDAAGFYPIDVAVQGAFVYVLDYAAGRLLRYDSRGSYLDVLLSFSRLERSRPVSVTLGEGDRFLTTDIENHTVIAWTPLYEREITIGGFGSGAGEFNEPRKAAFLPDGGIAVAESAGRRIQIFSPGGEYQGDLAPPPGSPLRTPRSICTGDRGAIFVADSGAGAVFAFRGGRLVATIVSFGGEPISPASVEADWSDRLYVADLRSRSVLVYRIRYKA